VILASSCSLSPVDTNLQKGKILPSILQIQSEELLNVSQPKIPIVVAVYPNSFTDQTGQRKSNSEFALFSTALTQAPSHLLIRSLKHTANGKFFRVAERVGLDNLTKERQLIRSAREQNEAKDGPKPIMPLLFAGVLMEGAVIGYDTNIKSGGIGARYLGIGTSKQYRIDNITVALRMISIATGEVLIDVLVSKQIYSYGQSQDVFKFIEVGTELVEIEMGDAENEPATLALQKAIEQAVLEIVKIGYDKGFWEIKDESIKIDKLNCDADCIDDIRG
jgi:curli production assembly/transport component CsgG|tara:strand:- start:1642 stop:2472 length:831 start_codon:yes stop_codon:yes gene_type:complete